MHKCWRGVIVSVAALLLVAAPALGRTGDRGEGVDFASLVPSEAVPGELMVGFHPDVSDQGRAEIHAAAGATVITTYRTIPWQHVRVPATTSLQAAANAYLGDARVSYVEPNYIVHPVDVPNDARYGDLWGMKRINAPRAWDTTVGSRDIVVAVIDTGIRRTHEDLVDNIWKNPGETGKDGSDNNKETNGIDDDGNGYIDDVYGWDFYSNDNDPTDEESHGTHCAGTIGGVGNNLKGVAGVNWEVSLVALRFLGPGGGSTAAGTLAVEYATLMADHIRLTSNSWGGGGPSEAMRQAIEAAGDAGQLFIAAAGNYASDNDAIPFYPASFDNENLISVASIREGGAMSGFSNYGLESVDIGAPGSSILSCVGSADDAYEFFNGTSMATPHVAGAAALLLSERPSMSWQALRDALLLSATPNPALDGKVATGGELNVNAALGYLGAALTLDRLAYRSDAQVFITVEEPEATGTVATVDITWETASNGVTRAAGTVTCHRVEMDIRFTNMLQLVSGVTARHGDLLTVSYTSPSDDEYSVTVPIDDLAPVITNVTIVRLGDDFVTVGWQTDESSDSFGIIGTSLPLDTNTWSGSEAFVDWGVTQAVYSHTVDLTGLEDETRYYAAVRSSDPAGNTATAPTNLASLVDDDYLLIATLARKIIFEDDMEAGEGRWTHTGLHDVWERGLPTSGPNEAASGDNCWATRLDGPYPNVMNAWLMSQPIVVELNPRIAFAHWLTLGRGDRAFVEVNGGSGWVPQVVLTDDSEGWETMTISLSQSFENRPIQVRFRLQSDGSRVASGWYVDDVVLSHTRGPGLSVKRLVLPVNDALALGPGNDADGFPEPGEIVQMDFLFYCSTTQGVSGVVATVDCPADGVTVDPADNTLDLGDFGTGDDVASTDGVGVTLTGVVAELTSPAPFFMTMRSDDGRLWEDVIYVDFTMRDSIEGLVSNLAGSAVIGASVIGMAPGQPTVTALSGPTGDYELHGMATGVMYDVYAVLPGDYSPSAAQQVTAPASGINFGLGRAYANVSPDAITLTLGQDDSAVVTLEVANTNAPADQVLEFLMDEDLTATTGGVEIVFSSGTGMVYVAAGATGLVDVTFTADHADVGVVVGSLVLRGNAVDTNALEIPVELTIEAGPALDLLFADGIDDPGGDGDGMAEPGESLDLWFLLYNSGQADAASLTGQVVFAGVSGAVVTVPDVDFGTVLVDDFGVTNGPVVTVDGGVADGTVLPFTLDLMDAAGHQWSLPFSLTVNIRYSIRGTVTDAMTSAPLDDVPLYIFGAGDRPAVKTSLGDYVFHDLVSGVYTVEVGDVVGYGKPPALVLTITTADGTADFELPPVLLSHSPASMTHTVSEGREAFDFVDITNDGGHDVEVHVRGAMQEGFLAQPEPPSPSAEVDWASLSTNDYFPDRLVIRFGDGALLSAQQSLCDAVGAVEVARMNALPLILVRLPEGSDLQAAAAALTASSQVLYVEPDYRYALCDTPAIQPNDMLFSWMWNLHNSGQDGGTPDNDIDAPEAWYLTTGDSNVIVAVADTGIDWTHPDLASNMWVNPGESGLDTNGFNRATNGVDDDANGYVDDVYGANLIREWGGYPDDQPFDDHGHGTHVAGTIGATGNNITGLVGVCWSVRLMALKIGDGFDSVSSFAAAQSIEYAIDKGARLSNHSWGAFSQSTALNEAIQLALANGHLLVCAAGNYGVDTDMLPFYPASNPADNVISVAASDRDGLMAGFSNYGANSVDLAAPGVFIWSTVPDWYVSSLDVYSAFQGTSMAAPHVAGVAALLMAYSPDASWDLIRGAILRGTVPEPRFSDLLVTGGHLNAYEALRRIGGLWMEFTPDTLVLAPSQTRPVSVRLNPDGLLQAGLYKADIVLECGITDTNRIPVTLNVTPGPVPEIAMVRVDDSAGGDGDGFAEPGESVDLYVSLYNRGTYSQPAAVGVTWVGQPGVTVTSGGQAWGLLESDETEESSVAAQVSFGPGVASNVVFYLSIDDGVNPLWVDRSFTLAVYPRYAVGGRVIDAGSGGGVSNARVTFYGADAGAVTSAADGTYLLDGLTAGTYILRAGKSGYGLDDWAGVTVVAADVSRDLLLPVADVSLVPTNLAFRVPIGETAEQTLAATNVGSSAWTASAYELADLNVAVIADAARLTDVETVVRSMGLRCDGGGNNTYWMYTANPDVLSSYDMVIADLSGTDGYGREIDEEELAALESYATGGGRVVLTGRNLLGSPDDMGLATLVGSAQVGLMPGTVSVGTALVGPGEAMLDGPFCTVAAGDRIAVTPQVYDRAVADTNVAVAVVAVGNGHKIIRRPLGTGEIVFWSGNVGGSEWTSPGVKQDMLRNYLLAAALFDSPWLEVDAAGPFTLDSGADTGLVVRATAPDTSGQGGDYVMRLLYVGNAVGSGMQSIHVTGEIGVFFGIRALSSTGVVRWNGTPLQGTGGADACLYQLIEAGADGTNSPATADGGTTGDDRLLMTFDRGESYGRIGDGYELGPEAGQFDRRFAHLLGAGRNLYVRAWDAPTFAGSVAYGDSTLYDMQLLENEAHDYGTWTVGELIEYPGTPLAGLRDQNADTIPDGWCVLYGCDPRLPIGPLDPTLTVEAETTAVNGPTRMAVWSNWVFVADTENSRVVVMDKDLTGIVTTFGSFGTGTNQFKRPHGIDIRGTDRKVAVADTFNYRVMVLDFDPVAGTLSYDTHFGSQGDAFGEFNAPYDVAVTDSRIYVADTLEEGAVVLCNHRIQRFSKAGVWQASYGEYGTGDMQFNRPIGVSVDDNGVVYVADADNGRVQCFNSVGILQWKFGAPGSGDGKFNWVSDIHVGRAGWAYVADNRNHRIVVLDASEFPIEPPRFVDSYGGYGSELGEFRYPWGLVPDVEANTLFIGDTENDRVQRVALVVDGDGDGMDDLWEEKMGLDPTDPDDWAEDPDGDGLINLGEFRIRTDPLAFDSNGNGGGDGLEVALGRDPLSFPGFDLLLIRALLEAPFGVSFNVEAGGVYQVQSAVDLVSGIWTDMDLPITALADGVYTWYSVTPLDQVRFFRIQRVE